MQNTFSILVLWIIVALLVSVPVQIFAQQQFLVDKSWRPESQNVLATYDGQQISELDLVLFLMMQDRDPSWLYNWEENTLETAYRNRLKATVLSFIRNQEIAATAKSSSLETILDSKTAGRVLAGIPINVSFADLIVADSVKVTNYDISLYFQKNKNEFGKAKGDGPSLETARDEIYRRIYPNLLMQQLEIKKQEAAANRYPINRADYLALLAPEVVILDLEEFEMSRAEFFDLYPKGKEGPFRFKAVPKAITDRVNQVMYGEAMIQELQDRGLLNQSWFSTASEIGSDIFLTQKYLAAPLDIQPTQDELALYVKNNQEALFPSLNYIVWALESDATRELKEVSERAKQLLEERVAVAGAEAYALPELVINRLLSEIPDSNTTFNQLPLMTAPDLAEQFGIGKSSIQIGSFSNSRVLPSGRIQSLYFASTRRRTKPNQSVLFEMAGEKIREDYLLSDVQEKITSAERNGSLTWAF